MNKVQQRQLGRMRRVKDFFTERASEFAEGSRAKIILADLEGVLAEVETQGPNGAKSNAKTSAVNKKALLNDLREELVGIERTARAIEKHNPEFEGKFQLPDKRKKDDLAGAARGILEEAEKVKGEFLAYELPENFLDTLRERLDAYEATQSTAPKGPGRGRRASASGETIERGLALLDPLAVIVNNKYRGQTEVLSSWEVANRASDANRGRRSGTKGLKAAKAPRAPRGSRTPRPAPADGVRRRPGRPKKVVEAPVEA